MIGFLSGKIASQSGEKVVILTAGGVGYTCQLSTGMMQKAALEKAVSLPISTIVREDAITLFGFETEDEKTLFEKLITVSGIGPKVAMSIINTSASTFLSDVSAGNVEGITRIPGIGKKTAQRIIVELQGKFDPAAESSKTPITQSVADAITALEQLGYDQKTVQKALKDVDQTLPAEAIIRQFLSSNA